MIGRDRKTFNLDFTTLLNQNKRGDNIDSIDGIQRSLLITNLRNTSIKVVLRRVKVVAAWGGVSRWKERVSQHDRKAAVKKLTTII